MFIDIVLFVSCNIWTLNHTHSYDFKGKFECGADISKTLDSVYDSLQFEGKVGKKYYFNVECADEPLFLRLDNSNEAISNVLKLSFYAEDGSLLNTQKEGNSLTLKNVDGLLYIVIEPTIDENYVIFLTE